jgi:peptidoglycan/LPS O-acetylase OafA/YrhL
MKDDRIVVLDALRGAAILMVLVWHYLVIFVGPATHNPIRIALGLTWTGVDLFFVLSGYLIGGILLDNRDSSTFFSTFYGRRALRILPLYFLSLALFLLLGFSAEDETPLWSYLLLLQNFVWSATGSWGPDWTGITWSLAVEEQFYLLLPLLIRFVPRRYVAAAFVSFAALGPLVRIVGVAAGYDTLSIFLLSPARFDPLFMGVFAAWLVRNRASADFMERSRSTMNWTLAVLASGMAALTLLRWEPITSIKAVFGYLLIASFYVALLLNVVTRPLPRSLLKPALALSWFGIRAYSLYLFHMPVLVLMRRVVAVPAAAEAVSLCLVLFGATLCWKYIEQPAMAFGRRRFRYLPAPAPSAPVTEWTTSSSAASNR